METMTYGKLKEIFQAHEATNPKEHLTAHIIFAEDSWPQTYPLESRTYVVSSNNKAFQLGKGGYSIFGDSLDASDVGVRLDQYMSSEHGGQNGWKVEDCILVKGEAL